MPNHGFSENDLKFTHINFGSGRGSMAIEHLPTGIIVQSDTEDSPVEELQRRLLHELETLVAENYHRPVNEE